jgi:hypothetical protein
MITRNAFARRHNAGSTENSICLKCFLTVSALEGGPNLREMETRHKCDPMNLFYSRETPTAPHPSEKRLNITCLRQILPEENKKRLSGA